MVDKELIKILEGITDRFFLKKNVLKSDKNELK